MGSGKRGFELLYQALEIAKFRHGCTIQPISIENGGYLKPLVIWLSGVTVDLTAFPDMKR